MLPKQMQRPLRYSPVPFLNLFVRRKLSVINNSHANPLKIARPRYKIITIQIAAAAGMVRRLRQRTAPNWNAQGRPPI